ARVGLQPLHQRPRVCGPADEGGRHGGDGRRSLALNTPAAVAAAGVLPLVLSQFSSSANQNRVPDTSALAMRPRRPIWKYATPSKNVEPTFAPDVPAAACAVAAESQPPLVKAASFSADSNRMTMS